MTNRLSPHAAFWLTIVRIYLGAVWLLHGLAKLLGGATAAFPTWYHGVLARDVMHNAHTLVPVLGAAEVLVGVLLIFGLFTRASAFGSLVLALGFVLTKGSYLTYSGLAGGSSALIVLSLVTLALAADFGVDGIARHVRQRKVKMPKEHVEATPVDIAWPE
ncbi:MAG: DoxX family protein [Candidatus Eremiobacteraeota bacterium]|nr:DoxX family protein [Candidatus Eremiobacteraeota bacterium]